MLKNKNCVKRTAITFSGLEAVQKGGSGDIWLQRGLENRRPVQPSQRERGQSAQSRAHYLSKGFQRLRSVSQQELDRKVSPDLHNLEHFQM